MLNLIEMINKSEEKITSLLEVIPVNDFSKRIDEIDLIMSEPNVWEDRKKASSIMKERQKLHESVSKILSLKDKVALYKEFAETLPEDLVSYEKDIADSYQEIIDFEFSLMLNSENDDTAAILSINAGAGGLEAANWVTMLLRMYLRYASNNSFKTEILDHKPSEEHASICTDSVSIRVEGKYAYGFLKSEAGVHRLIRNSPFNSGDARHTSFAAVAVLPDIEDTIDIKIEDKDIEITAQTAGGPGGQNQNRIKSAIRVRHFPTGINIIVRTERDQLSNKKTAMKMLKAKLYEIELRKKEDEKREKLSLQKNISFGSQIRTYTESPQPIVVDHRTELKKNDFNSVLDGDIKDFQINYLKMLL